MRFFFFNLVVMGALVYLVTETVTDFHSTQVMTKEAGQFISTAKNKLTTKAKKLFGKTATRPKPTQQNDDQIAKQPAPVVDQVKINTNNMQNPKEQKPEHVKTPIQTKKKDSKFALVDNPSAKLKPMLTPVELAPRNTHRPINVMSKNGKPIPLDPAIQQRRAEVMSKPITQQNDISKVTVKKGAKLMSHIDRRRELQVLIEDMELLYLSNIGE